MYVTRGLCPRTSLHLEIGSVRTCKKEARREEYIREQMVYFELGNTGNLERTQLHCTKTDWPRYCWFCWNIPDMLSSHWQCSPQHRSEHSNVQADCQTLLWVSEYSSLPLKNYGRSVPHENLLSTLTFTSFPACTEGQTQIKHGGSPLLSCPLHPATASLRRETTQSDSISLPVSVIGWLIWRGLNTVGNKR